MEKIKHKATQPKEVTSAIEVDGKIYNLLSIDLASDRLVKEVPYNVGEYVRKFDNGDIAGETPTQRTPDQWSKQKKSRFILSLLLNRPVGAILTAKGNSDSLNYAQKTIIDGLQRSTAMSDYINNRFTFSRDTPPIKCRYRNDDGKIISENFELAGKKFSRLPKVLQESILEYRLTTYLYEGFTDEELDNIMYCVNNGASFKPFQKMRIVLGTAIMEEIQPVCDGVFWEKAENINAKNDNILGCVIRSLMLLTEYNYNNLGTSEMTKFCDFFTENGSIKDIKKLDRLFNQLNGIIHRKMNDDEYTFLTPCFIPHLIMNLNKFNSMGIADDTVYTAFLNDFLSSDSYTEFNSHCKKIASGGGLYSRSSVEKRQAIFDNALESYVSGIRKTA